MLIYGLRVSSKKMTLIFILRNTNPLRFSGLFTYIYTWKKCRLIHKIEDIMISLLNKSANKREDDEKHSLINHG